MNETLALGQVLLGRYRLEARLGRAPLGVPGAPLAERFRVWDVQKQTPLGMLVLPEEVNANPEQMRQIQAACPPLTGLAAPGLIPFLGLFTAPGLAFLLEAWNDGPTLAEVLAQNAGRPLSVRETLLYVESITRALQPLRRAGVIHPVLAAEFVHVDVAGRLRLSLLPCALPDPTASQAGEVYALAALAYRALTGVWPPPPDSTPRGLNPAIPDFGSRILLQGLAPRAAERIPTAREFSSSLWMACAQPLPSALEALPPAEAPVTWGVLGSWKFLPLPPPAAPEKPLPQTHSEPAWKLWLPRALIVVLLLALLGSLALALARLQPLETQVFVPANGTLGAPARLPVAALDTPVATLPPRPTESHGGRIYFTCTRGDYNQICVINADGSGYNQLTTGPAHNYYPALAPQGGMLVYASNRGGLFDLYLLFFQSGNLVQLTHEIGNVVSPNFSPDGNTLVFANRAAEGPTSIWMVDKGGLNPRMVYAGPNTIVAAAWSPDGATIAFAMALDLPTEYQIFLMDVNGQNVRQISHGLQGVGGSLDWSPDGKSLLIYAGPVGDKDIFRLDVETGLATQLTRGGNNAASSYSPSGEFIVFNSLRNKEQADLYIMRADGSQERQLTDNPEPDWQPRWEP